ncbi:MAG: hypothetical protein ACR2OJ_18200 [Hyphomicrobiales bacterium]
MPLHRLARSAGIISAIFLTLQSGAVAQTDDAFMSLIGVTPEGQTCLLGGSLRGAVAEPDVIVDFMKPKQSYVLVREGKTVGDALSIGAPEAPEPGGDCEIEYLQELTLGPDQLGEFQLAAMGSEFDIKARLPGEIKTIDTNSVPHREFVKKYLEKETIEDPDVRLRQVLEVDFDGDGKPETIINALKTARSNVRAGEYSIVLVVSGSLEDPTIIEVHKEIALEDTTDPSLIVDQTVVSVFDIEGDGNKELVLYGAFAFGEGWQAYRIRKEDTEQVLFCGCG